MTSYDQIDGGHDDLFPIFLHSQLLLSALPFQMQLQLQQKQEPPLQLYLKELEGIKSESSNVS